MILINIFSIVKQMFQCGDNLDLIKTLDNDSVDLIYFNPPFAITEASYDAKPLNWKELWPEMWRVLKPNSAIVVHSSGLFTDDLVASQRKHFRYKWYWKKGRKTGHLFSKKQPMREIEEICVFYKKCNSYNGILSEKITPVLVKNTPGAYYGRTQNKIFTTKYNYKSHFLEFDRRRHPYSTRPVKLCEFVVETYTQPNSLVLDLTCSDGQTAIACRNLKRQYVGFDINENMIKDAKLNYGITS
jgi:site-specific DNA-methyltransferase (adenine-specific)